MSFESSFVALFAVATAVALAAKRIRIPYTVALVMVGLVLGATRGLAPPHLTKDLLYAIFLPGLVFEAAFHLDGKRFVRELPLIGVLAVPGILLSGALLAWWLSVSVEGLRVATGFGLASALLFSTLIVATDPIAVVGLFKTLGVSPRLATLVDGESIFNDGTAVAFFTVALGMTTATDESWLFAVGRFALIAGGGIVVGAAFGFVVSRIAARIADTMLEIALTTIAAYGSFIAAERLHASGVIATATAGLVCSALYERATKSDESRLALHSMWEYVAFALNSIVFLLIGISVPIARLFASWRAIVLAWVVVTVVRFVLVYTTTAIASRTRWRVPWSWAAILSWGGLRGALSIVLALSLPLDIAHRELIVTLTFGVVVLSILVQGLTMTPLLRLLPGARESDVPKPKA